MKHSILGWATGALLLLAGCGSDDSPTGPAKPGAPADTTSKQDSTTPPSGPRLSDELPGTWKADSSIQVKIGFGTIPAGLSMQISFNANGTFNSFADASFMQNPIQGHLYTQSGTWRAISNDTVVVKPLACMAADTVIDPAYQMALPFKTVGGNFVANDLKASDCPDSSLVTTHPVNDTLHYSMPVSIPSQGRSVWTLSFRKQP